MAPQPAEPWASTTVRPLTPSPERLLHLVQLAADDRDDQLHRASSFTGRALISASSLSGMLMARTGSAPSPGAYTYLGVLGEVEARDLLIVGDPHREA